MSILARKYLSYEIKDASQANWYVQTHTAPHRYLAYRDLPYLFSEFVVGPEALDYGSGTGASTIFLKQAGFDVLGMDVSYAMLQEAARNFPDLSFCEVKLLPFLKEFDLVFSSFVLFELKCKKDITEYLLKAFSKLKPGGIFIGITGSEDLYSLSRNWLTFSANFPENYSLQSGDIAKLLLKNPDMEFYDYYWTDADYLRCFKESGLEIIHIHRPIGVSTDPYLWEDEKTHSPFTIFIAQRPV